MADPTLEEQQSQTALLQTMSDTLTAQNTLISSQTAAITAQTAVVTDLKTKVDSYESSIWMTAFGVCLCLGAILFRVFTRGATAKRLLAVAFGVLISASAFAAPNGKVTNSQGTVLFNNVLTDGQVYTITPFSGSPDFQLAITLNLTGGQGGSLDMTKNYDNGNASTTQHFDVSSDPFNVVLDTGQNFCSSVVFTYHAAAPSGYTPPPFSCDSDSKYLDLKNNIKNLFPSLAATADFTTITFTFNPNLSDFSHDGYTPDSLSKTVTMDYTMVKCDDMMIYHDVFTTPLKLLVKFCLSLAAFAYCLKEVRQW